MIPSQLNYRIARFVDAAEVTEVCKMFHSESYQKFANFNLEGMALTDPAVLEGKVNRASARVVDNLTTITNPEQFDEEIIDNTAITN